MPIPIDRALALGIEDSRTEPEYREPRQREDVELGPRPLRCRTWIAYGCANCPCEGCEEREP